jgi:hypothetical protein
MNSSGEVQSPSQLETPASQEAPPQTGELRPDKALEKTAPDDSRVGKQQPPPVTTAPAAPPTAVDNSQTTTPDPTTTIPDSGLSARDTNKIEKQWIDKAKAIIAQTQDDPFIQKKEMSKVKAEYIQKRYNKTIPVDGTVTK